MFSNQCWSLPCVLVAIAVKHCSLMGITSTVWTVFESVRSQDIVCTIWQFIDKHCKRDKRFSLHMSLIMNIVEMDWICMFSVQLLICFLGAKSLNLKGADQGKQSWSKSRNSLHNVLHMNKDNLLTNVTPERYSHAWLCIVWRLCLAACSETFSVWVAQTHNYMNHIPHKKTVKKL